MKEKPKIETYQDILDYAIDNKTTYYNSSVHYGHSGTYLKNAHAAILSKYDSGKTLTESELCFITTYEQNIKAHRKVNLSSRNKKKINYVNHSNIILNADVYGQIFTPSDIVDSMISLIKNKNKKTLEPSAGDGAFSKKLNCVSIELDSKFKNIHTYNIDFFDYNISNKHNTIIGNPPYVKFKDITESTKKKLDLSIFDKRTNLYLFFIYKCLLHLEDNGELIFITPIEFIKSTAAIKLNNLLYKMGTITHFYDYGDRVVFPGFSPNVAIWRFEKDNFNRITETFKGKKNFININGQLIFSDDKYNLNFSDFFFVKVGGVSGMDNIFISENGNEDFVCSYTRTTGKLRRMYYNIKDENLEKHKDKLLQRKLKTFNDNNWWLWGRDFYHSDKERIYVNCKTRIDSPFFINPCTYYDGSVLAIFPKRNDIDMQKACEELNIIKWEDMGFKIGGRYVFTQKTLSNITLPNNFYDKVKKTHNE
jgi:adenine-specific DNA-methyltransferase